MINLKVRSAVIAGALTLVAAGVQAQDSADIEALRAQLDAMQAKLEQLEKQQKAQVESTDKTTDAVAQVKSNVGEWVGRFQWKGDLRYRNEQFDIETVSSDRIRDRIRARGGFVARINDTWRAEVGLATGGTDPRSSNQTLDGIGSRKDFELDLGYAEWTPNAMWKLTLGKQKQPWVKPSQSLFFDGDINPEGVAVNWASSIGVFADVFHFWLQERGGLADSDLSGAQLGWRSSSSAPVRFTIGAGYYDYGAVEGYPLLAPTTFNPFGNTVFTVTRNAAGVVSRGPCTNAIPNPPATPAGALTNIGQCLMSDYNVTQLFGEIAFGSLGGRPLTIFADYGQNGDVDAEDTAYSAGVSYGRITNPWTWELGYMYQEIEKDALLGQFIDSDFGDGNTDTKGSVFRFGLGITRNFNFNATYFLNDLNVSGLSSGMQNREYKRLQLDLNYRF